jgi:short-subunit dehydrogenase
MENMFKNKVIIITGSTQGIGLRTAEILSQRGALIVINSRSETKVEIAVSNLRETGAQVIGIAGDISSFDFCQILRDKTIERFGRIDYLINNAGLAAKGNLCDMVPETYQRIYDVNVLGSLYPTMAVLKDLKDAKGGVLFISSLAGIVGLPSYSAYSGTKSSIVSLAECFKNELLDDGVFVGLHYPGFTENDASKQIMSANGKSTTMTKREDVKVEPLNKTVGKIIQQIEMRKFRAFSSSKGRLTNLMYRISPSLALYVLKVNRRKIMKMQ